MNGAKLLHVLGKSFPQKEMYSPIVLSRFEKEASEPARKLDENFAPIHPYICGI